MKGMKHFTLSLVVAGLTIIAFFLGYAMKDPVAIKTVEKEVIVHPDFQFKSGDKTHCDLGSEVKPCEVIAQKSNGKYAIKYTHTGLGGGEKIIIVDSSQILR